MLLYRTIILAGALAALSSALPTMAEESEAVLDTAAVPLSFDGCVTAKQASIVLPSTNPDTLKAGLASIGKQFPVTVFATDAHFRDPQTLNLLQGLAAQKLHTIGYQFNPELSRNADKAQPAQIEAALKAAKQTFKTNLNQSLMYALVPSVGGAQFAEVVAKNSVYPVIPNASSDTLPKSNINAVKGVVLSVHPSAIESTPDLANDLFTAGFQITPLTHCLPVIYKEGLDLQAKKGNAVEGKPEGEQDNGTQEENSVASSSAGLPWGMIAIGAFVVGGVVLAVYFYRTQA